MPIAVDFGYMGKGRKREGKKQNESGKIQGKFGGMYLYKLSTSFWDSKGGGKKKRVPEMVKMGGRGV